MLTIQPLTPDQLRSFATRLSEARTQRPITVAAADEWQMPPLTVLEKVFERYSKFYPTDKPDDQLEDAESDDDLDDLQNLSDLELDENQFDLSDIETDSDGGDQSDETDKLVEPEYIEVDELSELPDELEVLGLPLLTFLAFRVMAQEAALVTEPERQAAAMLALLDEPTTLYRRLTDLVCPAAANPQQVGSHNTKEEDKSARLNDGELRRVLQETAACIAVQNNLEYITKREWEARMQKLNRGQKGTTLPSNLSMSRLMVSFYFVGGLDEQNHEQSIEFMHKSFREYLFAECIIETLKAFARETDKAQVERKPWRDFNEHHEPHHYRLSRRLAQLLSPQWLTNEVITHLEKLWHWEIERSAPEQPTQARSITDKPTEPLTIKQWEIVRDGLVTLWAWWANGAHLTPQLVHGEDDLTRKPAYVQQLILNWAIPLAEPIMETTQLPPPTKLDARLGDGLFRLTSLAHSLLIEQAGGLFSWPLRYEENPFSWLNAEDCQKISLYRNNFESTLDHMPFSKITIKPSQDKQTHQSYQTLLLFKGKLWICFAPSGEGYLIPYNKTIRKRIYEIFARINVYTNRPQGLFPAKQTLRFIDLQGALLDGTNFFGADLEGANLNFAHLEGARFDKARINRCSLNFATLNRSSFYDSKLNNAKLNGAALVNTNLAYTELKGAQLNAVFLNNANLTAANLTDAMLVCAIFNGANLNMANLSNAVGLTEKQMRSIGSIDYDTQLDSQFNKVKSELLEFLAEFHFEAESYYIDRILKELDDDIDDN